MDSDRILINYLIGYICDQGLWEHFALEFENDLDIAIENDNIDIYTANDMCDSINNCFENEDY